MKTLDEHFHTWWILLHPKLKFGEAINLWLKEQKEKEELKTGINPVKQAIDLSKKINKMPTTTKKRSKKHEHKPNNNLRIQITIDCRFL